MWACKLTLSHLRIQDDNFVRLSSAWCVSWSSSQNSSLLWELFNVLGVTTTILLSKLNALRNAFRHAFSQHSQTWPNMATHASMTAYAAYYQILCIKEHTASSVRGAHGIMVTRILTCGRATRTNTRTHTQKKNISYTEMNAKNCDWHLNGVWQKCSGCFQNMCVRSTTTTTTTLYAKLVFGGSNPDPVLFVARPLVRLC